MRMLDAIMIRCQNGFYRCRENLKEESGAINMIEVLVIAVIVIAIAAVFRDKLKDIVEKVFGNIGDFFDNSKGKNLTNP